MKEVFFINIGLEIDTQVVSRLLWKPMQSFHLVGSKTEIF